MFLRVYGLRGQQLPNAATKKVTCKAQKPNHNAGTAGGACFMKNQQGVSISAAKWKITFFCNHLQQHPLHGCFFLQIQGQHNISLARSQTHCHHAVKSPSASQHWDEGNLPVRVDTLTASLLKTQFCDKNHVAGPFPDNLPRSFTCHKTSATAYCRSSPSGSLRFFFPGGICKQR